MENNKKNNNIPILGIIIALVFSIVFTFFKTNDVFSKIKIPTEAYKVYLKGDVIGLIKSDQELYDYINKMQEQLMNKYKVNHVYVPNDIKVEKGFNYERR